MMAVIASYSGFFETSEQVFIVGSHGNQYYKQIMATLDKQVAQLQKEFQRHLNCKKGCSSCCENVQFKISYVEALELFNGFNKLPATKKQQVLANLNNDSSHCPFLIEGSCAAYKARPALCRGYGLLIQVGNDIGTCSLNFNEALKFGETLKKLDILPYYKLLAELSEPLWKQHAMPTVLESEDIAPRLSIRTFIRLLLRI